MSILKRLVAVTATVKYSPGYICAHCGEEMLGAPLTRTFRCESMEELLKAMRKSDYAVDAHASSRGCPTCRTQKANS